MNLVRSIANFIERRMSISDLDAQMDAVYGGEPTYTGKLVNQTNALQVSAVWACINIRANDLSTAPLPIYQIEGVKRELARGHYLWPLLQYEANPEMTAFRWKHLMQTYLDLWGNAYSEMEMNGRGQIVALWPWRPDRVRIYRMGDPMSGSLVYEYTDQKQNKYRVPQERMFHLRGLTTDGLYGLSPIQVHRQAVGLAMAMTEHTARFFGNGARPMGVLQFPGKLSPTARKTLEDSWNARHEGLNNAHRTALLEEGLTYKETGVDMVQAQMQELFSLSVQDIARIFNVPPHRVADLSKSTFSNIDSQGLEYVQYGIGPLAANWESEINYAMLSGRERQSIEAKFNLRHLIRGDYTAMGLFMAQMAQNGLMNDDELRYEFLDMNPKPNGQGKVFYKQVNMMPLGDAAQAVQPKPNNDPAKDPTKQLPPALDPKDPKIPQIIDDKKAAIDRADMLGNDEEARQLRYELAHLILTLPSAQRIEQGKRPATPPVLPLNGKVNGVIHA